LRYEIARRERDWSEASWSEVLAAADALFPKELRGMMLRVKKLERPLAGEMLREDLWHDSLAAAHLAHMVGGLDLREPLLAWAALPFAYDPTHWGDLSLMRYLIYAGADPNAKDDQGIPALLLCALREKAPRRLLVAIPLLLDAGADPAITDDHELVSALQALCSCERIDEELDGAIRLLLGRGASMLTPDGKGKTALARLQEGCLDGKPEGEISIALRGALIAEAEQVALSSLPQGKPPVTKDIDGRTLRGRGIL